jgi:hypothetical protein
MTSRTPENTDTVLASFSSDSTGYVYDAMFWNTYNGGALTLGTISGASTAPTQAVSATAAAVATTSIIFGSLAAYKVDASAILDGDESSATANIQQKLWLSLSTDSNGNFTTGSFLAGSTGSVFATTIGETDAGEVDGFTDSGAPTLGMISGTSTGTILFTYTFGNGGSGSFVGSVAGAKVVGQLSVADSGVSLTQAVNFSLYLSSKESAVLAALQNAWAQAGITNLATLVQNLPEAYYGLLTAMTANGLLAKDIPAFLQNSATIRAYIGQISGPAVAAAFGAALAGSQYNQDLQNKNPQIYINAATNAEKTLISVGVAAFSVASTSFLTPLGAIALGVGSSVVLALGDTSLTNALNNVNAKFIPLAGPSDFGQSALPSASSAGPQNFDPGYFISTYTDAKQALAAGFVDSALSYFLSAGLQSGELPAAGAAPIDPTTIPDAAAQAQQIESAGQYDGIFDLALGALAIDRTTTLEQAVGAAIFSGPAAPIATPALDKTLSSVANRYAFDLAYNQRLSGTIGDYFGATLPNLSNGDALSVLESAGAPQFNGFSVYVHSSSQYESSSQIVSSLQQDLTSLAPTGTQAYGIGQYGGEWVVITANLNPGASASAPTATQPATSDLMGFGLSSIVWRDASNGDTGFWALDNGAPVWRDLGVGSTAYSIAGIGDINDDGAADLIWTNSATGDVGYWAIGGRGTTAQWEDLGTSGSGYALVGMGDFRGDGASDMLWENSSTGDVGFWQLTNGENGWQDLGAAGAYSVVGVGDFLGDGHSDVLFQSSNTGDTGFWAIGNNGTVTNWVDLGPSGAAGYSVVGVGDFTGDGVSDILWRNSATGDTGYWVVNGSSGSTSWVDLGASGTAYSVAGVGDYYGGGTADILWRNSSSGDTGIWTLGNNGTSETWHGLGVSSTAYAIQRSA